MKTYLAEFIGTFAILFFGVASIAMDMQTNGAITLLGISTVFGLMVAVMIYIFGHISGAHFNPAVTLAFALTRRFPMKEVFPYFLAQLAGGLLALFTLKYIYPDYAALGLTLPMIKPVYAFLFEILLAFILIVTILFVSSGRNTVILAACIIGGTVTLEIFLGAGISGASFNPVRSLPPALVFSHLENIWIYLTAPFIGAVLGFLTFKTIHKGKYV